jgi:hypothetical protein
MDEGAQRHLSMKWVLRARVAAASNHKCRPLLQRRLLLITTHFSILARTQAHGGALENSPAMTSVTTHPWCWSPGGVFARIHVNAKKGEYDEKLSRLF